MKLSGVFIRLSLFMLLFLSSCVREGLDECPQEERYICFESVMDKYSFTDIVDHMTIYLYNAGNEKVFSRMYTVEDLKRNNYMATVPLQEDGTYTLLASMNSGNDYQRTEASELFDFNISLIPDYKDTVSRVQTDIYHGFRAITFTDPELQKRECDIVSLYKNTNHINIALMYEGYVVPEENLLYATIIADNGAYNYKNENLEGSTRVYLPYRKEIGSDSYFYNFTVMHVKSGNSIFFHLNELGENEIVKSSLTKDLLKEIMKVYKTDEELDQEDVFDIKIILDKDMSIISLLVNGWYAIRDGVDL